jgi:hypothetical protein
MPRGLARRNTMAFPRELRNAIPDLHTGRVLELDSINRHAYNFWLSRCFSARLPRRSLPELGPGGESLDSDARHGPQNLPS